MESFSFSPMRYLLGVDIGTYSSKGVLVKESGEVAASSVAGLEPLAASFNDKIILIGSSSAALCDFVETPLGRVPGVKAQALMTQLVLNGHVLKPPQ